MMRDQHLAVNLDAGPVHFNNVLQAARDLKTDLRSAGLEHSPQFRELDTLEHEMWKVELVISRWLHSIAEESR